MRISFGDVAMPQRGILALGIPEGLELSPFAKKVDADCGGLISRALKKGRFKGKKGQTLSIVAPEAVPADSILLFGLGTPKDWVSTDVEGIGGGIYKAVATSGDSSIAVVVEGIEDAPFNVASAAAHIGYGARLASYRFDRYLTNEEAEKKPSVTAVRVLSGNANGARKAFEPLDRISDGIFLSRDLVSEPANVLYPKEFARRCRELEELGLSVEILGEREMKELGMGALLGVSQGSAHEAQLVIMDWNGLPKGSKSSPVAFIGKGVTFDSGGISIKPAQSMEEMKFDMGGAGTVTGLMKALAGRKAKVRAVGVIGLVENMPSHTAQRPGDVVTSMSGQTIEIINTDAEGRLVLADALWYTKERFKPQFMINLATLTGAMIIALGHEYAGVFSNDDSLTEQLRAAGEAEGEGVWPLPMGEAYDKMLESPIADMKNVGERAAGSITAAQFLKRFVGEVPWAHLDIAGMAWKYKESDTVPKGGSGYGVRLLDRLIADYYETDEKAKS